MKAFSGEKRATIYFWRAVGWNKKGDEVQQMLTRVRAEVVAKTSGRQAPWSNSSLLGEVHLAAK
jgi:uncharacterized caspase-like protein